MTTEQENKLLALLDAVQDKSIDLGKVAVSPKGLYSKETNYEILDLVKFSNSAYLSLCNDNKGNEVSDETKWLCIINGEDAVTNAAKALNAANSANEAAGNATQSAAKADAATDKANKAAESAQSATNEAQIATADAKTIIATASQIETLGLIPTGLEVSYPAKITMGNTSILKIVASLSPSTALQNILFLADNNAVSVAPDGTITVNKAGKSTVYIVPTMKTSLYKGIVIEVVKPSIRMATATSFRLTGDGKIRLT